VPVVVVRTPAFVIVRRVPGILGRTALRNNRTFVQPDRGGFAYASGDVENASTAAVPTGC
jgi:hypothetical protein